MVVVSCTMKSEWIRGPLEVSYTSIGDVNVVYGWKYSGSLESTYEHPYVAVVTLKLRRKVRGSVDVPPLLSGPLGVHGDTFSSMFPIRMLKRDPPVMGEAALIA